MGLSALTTMVGTLAIVLALVVGLGALARRFNLAEIAARRAGTPQAMRLSMRIDRARTLSIVTLGGVRFALLTGGAADQMRVLPLESGEPAP